MAEKKVRESVIAGSWYPGKKEDLAKALDSFLKKPGKQGLGKIRALVAPHAGYAYSGQVAAYAYKQITGVKYSGVIVLAPSHHVSFGGMALTDKTHYRTPLGDIAVSEEARMMEKGSKLVKNIFGVDEEEHSLEIQLPFLQRVLDAFELIPFTIGRMSMSEIDDAAGLIIKHLDEETLIVASTDLSHYYPYNEAVSMDNECVKAVTGLDVSAAQSCEMCGIIPVLITMSIAKKLGWKTRFLNYANSGDVTGDRSGVVGYAAIALYE
jgi:AmmeMemoRadiSam system protein B